MIAWSLFVHPLILPSRWELWLILPLCFSVALVYKTVRIRNLNRLGWEVAVLMAYMTGGLMLLGAVLWLIQRLFL